MKLPYKYRGVVYLSLLFVLLPWAAWYYAIGNTVYAAIECRRLTTRLQATDSRAATSDFDPAAYADQQELVLSGVLLDALQGEIAALNLRVTGYVPVITEQQEGLELHTAQFSLTGRFVDLIWMMRYVQQNLPQCRLCAAVWQCATDRTTRKPQLTLTIYVQQLIQTR